jgi:predicted RNase H-like nuclease (RuvC/YqgF family)
MLISAAQQAAIAVLEQYKRQATDLESQLERLKMNYAEQKRELKKYQRYNQEDEADMADMKRYICKLESELANNQQCRKQPHMDDEGGLSNVTTTSGTLEAQT